MPVANRVALDIVFIPISAAGPPGVNIRAAIAIAVSILAPPDFEPARIGVITISPSVRGSKHSLKSSISSPCTLMEKPISFS